MFARLAALALCLCMTAGAAHAALEPMPPAEKPLLTIRFNQRTIYFDRALAQAIQKAEQAKPGVIYSVVSYTPSGPAGNRANANLATIVGMMQDYGVPQSRLRISTQLVPADTWQEVQIFVY